tara:strand:+ start:2223 stop:2456 length:234 start_codon:yes stop_codon:yes gene_type:complete
MNSYLKKETMSSKHVPKDNTYVHTFACTFPTKPQIAAEVLYEEYPEQAVELAKEIFLKTQFISLDVARIILDKVSAT